MKYLKRFNESRSDDFADYLYSIFEKDPNEFLQGDDWYFGRWYFTDEFNFDTIPQLKNLDKLLNSKRFSNLIVINNLSDDESIPKKERKIFSSCLDILIVSPDYYRNNSKWLVSNLIWEPHPLDAALYKIPEIKKIGLFSNKSYVKDLPNNCSLIKGFRFDGGLEFWPRKHTSEPIYVENNVELQALIYKYICDE
jgi:hypothetical protein